VLQSQNVCGQDCRTHDRRDASYLFKRITDRGQLVSSLDSWGSLMDNLTPSDETRLGQVDEKPVKGDR
jgi:hypothetical protein